MSEPGPDVRPPPVFNLTSKDVAALKAEAQDVSVTVHMGKDGLTPALAAELARQLKDHRLVKARLLRSARAEGDKGELAADLARDARAFLVEVRGNTAVFYKPSSSPRRR